MYRCDKSMTKFGTPILFLIFNQPEKTRETFSKICEIKPSKLFIAADGPREGNEIDLDECKETRDLIESMIDWDCEVYRRYQTQNLGCKSAVSSAITWFFEHCDEGIILEYDCVPSLSFFTFCEKMLTRYRNESRVMSISGTNYQFGKIYGDGDYYYSKIPSVWGWATWRRAWNKWEGDLIYYPAASKENMVERYFRSSKSIKFWNKKFYQIYHKIDDTWGLPWVFYCFFNDGISVTPNRNLVTNIGFSKKGTHAIYENDIHANMERFDISEFNAPTFRFPFLEADEFFTHDLARLPMRIKLIEMLRALVKKFVSPNQYLSLKVKFHALKTKLQKHKN